jgi:lysophospholipase L1-like esterase
MNNNKQVYHFVLISTGLYLALSLVLHFGNIKNQYLQNINLFTLVLKKQDEIITKKSTTDISSSKQNAEANKTGQDFLLYQKDNYITGFQSDTTAPSLSNFFLKLYENKTGKKKRKIRIAYFGDSMIEGDLMSSTFRDSMQKMFGGSGVGFVPIRSIVSGLRMTARTTSSGQWSELHFKNSNAPNLYLSGYSFKSQQAGFTCRNNVINDTLSLMEKSLLCGYGAEKFQLRYNGTSIPIYPSASLNRVQLSKDGSQSVNIDFPSTNTPIYGVSFESESGVIVDNFSFRGITGIEFNLMSPDFLKAIQQANHYDLIILQYGVNLLFRPNETNFRSYQKSFAKVVDKFKTCFSDADILIISAADRAFRYGQEYKTAVGLDSLIYNQAELAFNAKSAFFNLYATMGGQNSIVTWARMTPPQANKDYVHPNHRGAAILGTRLYQSFLREYQKYLKQRQ